MTPHHSGRLGPAFCPIGACTCLDDVTTIAGLRRALKCGNTDETTALALERSLARFEARLHARRLAIAVAVAWHTKAGAAVGHRRHDLAVVAQSWAMEAGR